ncbi:MAG: CoA transferase, partial [Armatimonadota bacterium]|nr:CoA transferase [Armatimonadota bacterium]
AMEELGRAGVPAGAVFGTDELAADPELRRAGLVAEVEEPEGGKVVMVGLPVRLSASEVVYRRAPRLGEHNEEIYGELGLTMSELEALRRAGVI